MSCPRALHSRFLLVAALLACALAGGVSAAAQSASVDGRFDLARAMRPEVAQLENGLDIVVISDHRVPVVTHMLWYRVGAADEVAGKSGLAHFFEHLLFKGTEAYPGGAYSDTVARNGGQDNAFTSWDFTAFYARVAKDRLPLIMTLEADRMEHLILTEEVFLPERDVILEERAMRIDNNPSALFREEMSAALYRNHRYGVPVIGWAHEVAGLTQQDALAFYKRYYAPNNAILIVSGDVTMADVLPLAEKHYGKLKPSELPPRVRTEESPHRTPIRVTLQDGRVRQPSMQRMYLAPSINSGGPADAAALEVLSAILGEGLRSRLHRRLVLEEGAAIAAGTGYFADALDAMSFSVYAVPKPGVSMNKVEALLDEEIERIRREGVTAQEVETVVTTLVNDAIFSLDDPMTINMLFGYALTTGGTIDRVLTWPEDIRGVTPDRVQAMAMQVLDKRGSVTGYLLPEGMSAEGDE